MVSATIPNVFQSVGEGSITTYNYADIQNGTGVIILQGANSVDQTTSTYFLSNNSTYSNDISTNVTTSYADGDTTTFTKTHDIDFDLRFAAPKNIIGFVRGILTWSQGHSTTANRGGSSYVIMKVRKWDGTTETELGSSQSETLGNIPSLSKIFNTVNLAIQITSRKHFKIGEFLRITIEIWASGQGASPTKTDTALYHDPRDRAQVSDEDTAYTTKLEIHVPEVLDL